MDDVHDQVSVPIPGNHYPQQEGIWPSSTVHLHRGRQAKNPKAKTVDYSVTSLEDFENSLREYLNGPPEEPEHTECHLSFWTGASFLVAFPPLPQPQRGDAGLQAPAQAPPGYQAANSFSGSESLSAAAMHAYQSVENAAALALPYHGAASTVAQPTRTPQKAAATTPMSIAEALAPNPDTKEKMRKQRAIAKCCVDAIQRVDGYRYSFHNCWNSREDDSYRFSYYCNDSFLNKDRAANGKGNKVGKRATKPVFDCKGVLSVKFSATKQSLDVYYKHVPIHKTYEERAPLPRSDSRRRKHLEETDPEALERLAARPRSESTRHEDRPRDPDAPPKPRKKRVKKDDPKTAASSIESDLRAQSLRSLLELIRPDPEPPAEDPKVPDANSANPAVEQAQPPRKRIPNTCLVCKAKKTKCDGTRPECGTCREKNRQCMYNEDRPNDDRRQSVPNGPQTPAHSEAQAATEGLSELEKMKKELEEARARIQQLEDEKSGSIGQPPRSHSQPQPQAQPPPQPPPQPQLHNPQALQAPQYSHFPTHTNHSSYGMNRAASQPSQIPEYSAPQASQPQPTRQLPDYSHAPQPSQTQGTHQMPASATGTCPPRHIFFLQDHLLL